MLIEWTVFFAADVGVRKLHTAAFTDELSRTAEQRIDRNVKQLWKYLERFGIGHRFAVFPTGNRLTCNEHLFRKLVLGKTVFCSEIKDNIFGFHTITAFDYCAFIIANFSASFKQRVVAFGVFVRKTAEESSETSAAFWFSIAPNNDFSTDIIALAIHLFKL